MTPPPAHPSLAAARAYYDRGWRVVPIPTGRKGPTLDGWQHLRLTREQLDGYWEHGGNIGLLTGAASGGLVDVDLDSAEARAVARELLPDTDRTSGRSSSRSSHWWYVCDPIPPYLQFKDPVRSADGARAELVELRADDHQTMVPPSGHPSGEMVTWEREGEPALVHGGILAQAVAKVAAAALLARHWPGEGGRHDAAMALGGALAHAGWEEEDAGQFVGAVVSAADDPEEGDRLRAVASSFESIRQQEEVTGLPTLATLLPKRVVDLVVEWLGLRDNTIERELMGAADAGAGVFEPTRSYPTTDLGNGERFFAQHHPIARYSFRRSVWYTWVGTHWQQDELGHSHRLASRTVRSILQEAAAEPEPSRRKALAKWARDSESQSRRDAMLRSAAEHMPIDETQFDRDPWQLNCLNGVVDLQSGRLLPHDSHMSLSKCCHVSYDPAAQCPRWREFLDRIMGGRQSLVEFLHRALGYSLTGRVSEDSLFFLYGIGRNGKSTFIRTIKMIMGDYSCQAVHDLLLAKHAPQHPTELANLFGRRFVAAVEAGAGRSFDEALVKQLTGGDAITARRMREDFWEFTPTHKIWLAANHKPVVKGGDVGIWSRLKTIPFEVVIPEDQQDKRLDEKLQQEAAGILAWMVEGCLAWQRDGLGEPAEVRAATGNYRAEMDVLRGFIEDCCAVDDAASCPAADLYAEYMRWCLEEGEKAESKRGFGVRMEERGFRRCRIGHRQVRGYTGLRLLAAPASDATQAPGMVA